VDAVVVGLVLVAAVLHVVWNVLLKSAGEPLRTAAVGTGAAALVVVPLAAVGWWSIGRPAIPSTVLVIATLSGAVETVYFVLLAAAYRRGDLSVVYPTARGTAPLLAVVVGVGILGERLGPIGFAGVAAILTGILVLQRPWRGLRAGADPRTRAATVLALGAGVCIATYSALDRVGVRETEPWLYAALIWLVMASGLVGVTLLGAQAGWLARGGLTAGVDVRTAALGGLLTLVAYGLVLLAFTVAPLTAVAPLRESAVVLASGWGVLRLGEAVDRRDATRRIVASGLVVLGIVLLVID
jgi:drug/metabolite transporter (DMT)-like permease